MRLSLAPRASLAAIVTACVVGVGSAPARADEGMWPFNMVPKGQIQKDHGVALTDAWLDHVRLSSVRFNRGGSGSFVSANGLVLTNHHVASDCISKIASAQRDYLDTGYLAGVDGGEVKCPDLELNVLVSIEDVTDTVKAARADGMSDADANKATKAAMAKVEQACADAHGGAHADATRCDVVTLYAGGKYQLYTYKKYKDVRLVFAPEQDVAFFGGDPDNFTYPRFDLDLAIFRVYEGDKAVAPHDYLHWSATGPKDGDTVFVSGHPGKTDRMDTLSQLTRLRDVLFPYYLDQANRERTALRAFADGDTEREREIRHAVFRLENGIKAITGEAAGLRDPVLMAKKEAAEAALKKAVAADAALAARFGSVWDDAEKAQKTYATIYKRYAGLERAANRSELFGIARTLVRLPHELAIPSATRLREYRDSALDSLRFELFSGAPIYGGVEAVELKTWLDRLVRDLGAGDPLVVKILAGRTTAAAAAEMVAGSTLTDPYVRHALHDGGVSAVDASTDPLIQVVKMIDEGARAARKQYEDEVEGPMRQVGEKITRATFAVNGTGVYPDATFTLRLSPGVVKGYREGARTVPWATDFAGMYGHATGKQPRKLPQRWLDHKGAVKMDAPLDFVSTNDIIGGNSGSPVVNASGELVGLIFDGNLTSLPNAFVYTEVTARAVSVDSAGMLEALTHVFGADALVRELTGPVAQ
jgi:hypothetical protein